MSTEDTIAEMFAGTLNDVEQGGNQLQKQMELSQAKVADMTDAIVAKLGRKKAEFPPQVLEIAGVLTAQPQLIPIVQAVMRKVAEELNAAVAAVVAKYTPPQ